MASRALLLVPLAALFALGCGSGHRGGGSHDLGTSTEGGGILEGGALESGSHDGSGGATESGPRGERPSTFDGSGGRADGIGGERGRSSVDGALDGGAPDLGACGTPGLACCESIACLSGACCVGGTCTAAGSACGASTICQSGTCVACGGARELCCAGGGCGAPGCCVGSSCVAEGTTCDPTAGTVCVSGRCEAPVAIATGEASPYGLAVSSGVVYWANASSPACGRSATDCGQVLSTPATATGGLGTVLWSGPGVDSPYFVATNGADVGFTCNGFDHVYADTMTAAGGSHTIIYSSAGATAPSGCAMNGSTFYWADPFRGLFSSPIFCAGCGGTMIAGGHPYAVALDASRIYWSDTAASTLSSMSLGGGAASTIATGVGRVFFLATDGTNVYFADNYNGVVGQVPVAGAGGGFTTLASGESSPLGVATDATNVYWADNGGTIQRIKIGGGTKVTLAIGQGSPVGLALDASNVYWADNGSGQIMKLTK